VLASAYGNEAAPSLPSVQYLQRALSLTTADASQLARSLSQLSRMTCLGSRDVRVALLALAEAKLNDSEAMERVEVVCTAPVQLGLPVRATFATTIEMVQSARETIILVGYVFTEGARELVRQLALARSNRRVKVTLVGNQMRTHLPVLRALWPHDMPPPRMYSREADPTDEMAALHAKLLVCDNAIALVTSANFTYHGLHENIEIGVKVQSKSVVRITEFVDALIAGGEVQAIGWQA
jgi:phosphatidylserine/phosphatidylglycerophosphate/cardiolipin synthase-like enzyme